MITSFDLSACMMLTSPVQNHLFFGFTACQARRLFIFQVAEHRRTPYEAISRLWWHVASRLMLLPVVQWIMLILAMPKVRTTLLCPELSLLHGRQSVSLPFSRTYMTPPATLSTWAYSHGIAWWSITNGGDALAVRIWTRPGMGFSRAAGVRCISHVEDDEWVTWWMASIEMAETDVSVAGGMGEGDEGRHDEVGGRGDWWRRELGAIWQSRTEVVHASRQRYIYTLTMLLRRARGRHTFFPPILRSEAKHDIDFETITS